METAVDFCYIELLLRCDRAPRSNIDKFIWRLIIPYTIFMFKVSKKRTLEQCQIYSKLTMKTPE